MAMSIPLKMFSKNLDTKMTLLMTVMPIGVALIYYLGDLSELKMRVDRPSLTITRRQNKRWISFIHKHLVDLVVYGRKTLYRVSKSS